MNALLLALIVLPALAGGAPQHQPTAALAADGLYAVGEEESQTPAEIFALVERSIQGSDLASITKSFGRQVYVSLKGGENGYFSANQASYILQSFFNGRRLVNFSFSTIQQDGEPFATGSGVFLTKGTRETLQVYVAVARQGSRWVISQFNVY
jgi:hypothetical protein